MTRCYCKYYKLSVLKKLTFHFKKLSGYHNININILILISKNINPNCYHKTKLLIIILTSVLKDLGLLKPDFRVSTAILNPVDIFRRWCKLNFGLSWGHVKSRHITAILLKGQAQGDNSFTFYTFLLFLEQWKTILDTGLNLSLPFKRNWIRLGPG